MDKFTTKVLTAIQEEPSYKKLDKLHGGVWRDIGGTTLSRDTWQLGFSINPMAKMAGVALLFVSCLALSQVTFKPSIQRDLFDLRYFSYQMLPSTDVVVASYEVKP